MKTSKIFGLGLFAFVALVVSACGLVDYDFSQLNGSSEPAHKESSKEIDYRSYDALKGDGYEIRLDNLYYTLESLELGEHELFIGFQAEYALRGIEIEEGQEVEFFKDGETLLFYLDAGVEHSLNNTQERPDFSPYETIHIHNYHDYASIYFKVWGESNSVWVTGYELNPSEIECYVVGSFNSWTQLDDNYKMTQDPDNEYIYRFEGLELSKGSQFKCTDNAYMLTWYAGDGCYGDEPNCVISEDGVYTITLNLQPGEGEKYVSAEKTDDYGAPAAVYFLVGTFNEWLPKDESYMLTADYYDTNHYYIEITFAEDTNIKIVSSIGLWYGDNSDDSGNGGDIPVDAGTYIVHFYAEVDYGSHIDIELLYN